MPQRRLPTPVRHWLRNQATNAHNRRRAKVGALVYCLAAALLFAAAAGTGVAMLHARRSVSQVERMHEVPWVGGELTIREPGTFALYRVQPGYADMPRTPMPSMWIYAPNGLPLKITPTPTQAEAKAPPAGAARAGAPATGGGEAEAPISSRSIKLGDIVAEELGTVDIGAPGTYEVRFTMPMRVGDALLVSPPVDRFVPPMVTSLKLAAAFEVLGLLILLGALIRHLLANRGKTLSGLVLAGVHRVGSVEQHTFEEVADTFGASAARTRRRHRSHREPRPRSRPVIDLRSDLPPPPAAVRLSAPAVPSAEGAAAAPGPGRGALGSPPRPEAPFGDVLSGFPSPRPHSSDLPRAPRRRARSIPAARGADAMGAVRTGVAPAATEPFASWDATAPGRPASVGRHPAHDLDLELDLRTGAPRRPTVGDLNGAGLTEAARNRVIRVPRPRLDRTR